MNQFALLDEDVIKSGGYVVHTLEAVIWCLLNTDNYRDCVLRAVNLGNDTDTVGAIAGSLVGLWYGYEEMSEEWIDVIARREWIEELVGYTFDSTTLPLKILRSNRKTISIEIKADGLLVRAPQRMSVQEIYAFLNEKSGWIEKHQQIMQKRQEELNQLPPFTAKEIRELAERALIVIPERVEYYAHLIGVDYGRITIRRQRTRWGSCSSKGNLNFNCLLMLMPDDVIDYVVVHELCHRKQMNHSAQFYAEIEKVFPEYRRCWKWLKENGSIYLSRLP